jgi:hypothetical protein
MDKPAASANNLAAGLAASVVGSLTIALGGVGIWLFIGACIVLAGAAVSILAVHQLAKGIDYLVHKSEADVDA